jgi:bacteriocin biosynthesis cyclodehydratase domain-containing protein
VVLRDASPAAQALVAALEAGDQTHGELRDSLVGAGLASAPEVDLALHELTLSGLLTESAASWALEADAASRYDRQLHYFADQARPAWTAEAMQQALTSATVVVLGAGGLGCWTLSGLACAGIGRLVAVDDDRIELTNLNRQILYRTADVHRPKVEVACETLRGLNPALDVVAIRRWVSGVSDVRSLARDADFVVCTADSPSHLIGRWVNEACLDVGVPHISAGQFPPRVRIGPTFVPGSTGCLACQELGLREEFPLYDELVAHRQGHTPVAATLGAASGLIGSLIAMEVIHAITLVCQPATLGRALIFDLRDFSSHWEPVPARSDCPLTCRE